LAVDDLDATIRDYSERLGADPVAVVPGKYALWRTAEVNLSVTATSLTANACATLALRTTMWSPSQSART
jgi:hypothetical protein